MKWDMRFLRLAEEVSKWSKDPSTKCGSIIVKDRRILSYGYNGFPTGCDDHEDLYDDRSLKYERVVHGEVAAIISAKQDLSGATLYSWPKGVGPSCARCSAVIIQAGIRRVVYLKADEDDFASRWADSASIGLQMYEESGVEIIGYTENQYLSFE